MILEGKNIVMLSLMKFDGEFESTNYTIAKYLAKNNKVFWVDNPYTWKDYFNGKGTAKFNIRKPHFSLFGSGVIKTDNPDLNVIICPPLASINFLPEGKLYRAALKLNQLLIINRIKKVLKRFGVTDYIYINSYNFNFPDVGDSLKPQLKAYHCVDPLIGDFSLRHGRISEDYIVKTSDVVICTSKQLYTEKKQLNPDTYFVPNAADISHSQQALNADTPVHPEIARIKKPVLGYFGNIERRIDYDLIREVAAQNADKSFVFAGPQEKQFIPEWFYDTTNIYLTGRMPYEQLPSVLKGFDIALLPFKKDEVSRTIFPLKLFEYLGAGKPVVSTDFNPDLQEFTGNTVAYCTTADEFTKAINNALENGEQALAERLAIAANNTWEKRSTEFSTILAKYLEAKSGV